MARLRGATAEVATGDVAAFYRHGWQSWSATRWLDPAEQPATVVVPERLPLVDDPLYADCPLHGGSAVAATRDFDGDVTLLGALDVGGRVELDDGRLGGRFERLAGEWYTAHGAEDEVFAGYAAALAEHLGQRPRHRSLTMWSSWYSYYGGVDESVLHGVLDDVAGLRFDIFQVDDGWQRGIGDWRANGKFPAGLADLAARITDRGMRPGLWLAPFIVRDDTALFRDRPDLFVRDDDGRPVAAGHNWHGPCHGLDLTHPTTLDVVGDAIRHVIDAGFSVLKLDFLCTGALPGRRHEDVPREVAYRRGVEHVRAVAGDDVYLLACGAPVIPSLGVFDGIRVGPDVAPWWELEHVTRYLHDISPPNTRYAIATSLHRMWLGSIIDTDPDVAYFRTRYSLLNARQRGYLQDLARVAGFRATSDPPAWLTAEERTQLAAFLEVEPIVEHVGGHRYVIDGRDVDFGPVAAAPPAFVHWLPQ